MSKMLHNIHLDMCACPGVLRDSVRAGECFVPAFLVLNAWWSLLCPACWKVNGCSPAGSAMSLVLESLRATKV